MLSPLSECHVARYACCRRAVPVCHGQAPAVQVKRKQRDWQTAFECHGVRHACCRRAVLVCHEQAPAVQACCTGVPRTGIYGASASTSANNKGLRVP
eukprot:1158921-Pelagomonas_calceolata.AAC.2